MKIHPILYGTLLSLLTDVVIVYFVIINLPFDDLIKKIIFFLTGFISCFIYIIPLTWLKNKKDGKLPATMDGEERLK